MRDRGINHHLVTPHWPQANEEAESFMKPLGKAVKAAKMEGKDWKAGLQYFLSAYRTTLHCTTGVAPSQLLFNRKVRTNIPTVVKEGDIDYKILHEQARINTSAKQSKAQQYTGKRRRSRKTNIEVGIIYENFGEKTKRARVLGRHATRNCSAWQKMHQTWRTSYSKHIRRKIPTC